MRIGIDARMLGPHTGGLGRYTLELVRHLEKLETRHEYVIFLRQDNWHRCEPATAYMRKALLNVPWYSIEEQLRVGAILQKEHVDLMHFPHWNVPLFYRKPFVVTIHDLIMWHFPREEASTHGPLVYWLKDAASRLVVRSAARRAKHILTTSEYTKNDIHETLGVGKERMTVTYQAPFEEISRFRDFEISKLGVTKPYVLYVGNAYPHKNLGRLVDAWQIVEEKTHGAYQLVLVGKENYFYEKLSRNIQKSGRHGVVLTGFVEDHTLEALYANARLYVAPSMYEGFALSALEAIARGIPVVASSASCFPEVLGESALYVHPENVLQIADALCAVLDNESLRAELRERGVEELKRYSWESLARRTLHVYEAAGRAS